MNAAVSLQGVSCVYPAASSSGKAVRAVDNVNLDIQQGEFFTLLGPSGSGKTTCLRMIGGFTLPTSGKISIYGQDVSKLPPYARPVNTVFQDYALFPHMTVLDNVAYGLMVKNVDRATRQAKARALLETIQLPDVADRKPGQLSGGQRQRVALARALINEPKVLLLDEPLGALDLKMREQMQTELKALQRKLGISFLFITHDQHEALSMSDRVGVFNQGRLEQVDTPQMIYNRPKTRFVAQFIGAANLLEGVNALRLTGLSECMLRPEQIHLCESAAAKLTAVVKEKFYFGAFMRLEVQTEGSDPLRLVIDIAGQQAAQGLQLGDSVYLNWDATAVHPLQAST